MHDEIDGLCFSSLSPPGEAPEGDSNGSSLTIFVALSVKRWRLEVQLISFVLGAMFEDVLVLDDTVPLFGLCSRVLAFVSLPSPFLPSTCSLVETAIFLDEADMRKRNFRPIIGLLFAVRYVMYIRREVSLDLWSASNRSYFYQTIYVERLISSLYYPCNPSEIHNSTSSRYLRIVAF